MFDSIASCIYVNFKIMNASRFACRTLYMQMLQASILHTEMLHHLDKTIDPHMLGVQVWYVGEKQLYITMDCLSQCKENIFVNVHHLEWNRAWLARL